MPNVEYRCRQCDARFERVVLRGEEEKVPACPACGSRDTGLTTAASSLFDGIASFSRLSSDRN